MSVHSEVVPLNASSVSSGDLNQRLYSTPLAPGFWKTICESPGKSRPPFSCALINAQRTTDPTRYSIFHEVVDGSTSQPFFSAVYKFSYPQTAPGSASYGVPRSNGGDYGSSAPLYDQLGSYNDLSLSMAANHSARSSDDMQLDGSARSRFQTTHGYAPALSLPAPFPTNFFPVSAILYYMRLRSLFPRHHSACII
jgi:hypothetical protein